MYRRLYGMYNIGVLYIYPESTGKITGSIVQVIRGYMYLRSIQSCMHKPSITPYTQIIISVYPALNMYIHTTCSPMYMYRLHVHPHVHVRTNIPAYSPTSIKNLRYLKFSTCLYLWNDIIQMQNYCTGKILRENDIKIRIRALGPNNVRVNRCDTEMD